MKILVLPGMGDIYWTAVALEDFARFHGCDKPEVWVWNFDGRPRSLEYVERIPFVTAGGYWSEPHDVPEFRESYLDDGRSVFPDFHGFDFYLSANGALRHGRTVEDAFAGYRTDWYFPLLQTDAERAHEEAARAKWGKYIVAHFSEFGMFSHWVRAWGEGGCAQLVRLVQEETGRPVLLTGCEWDRPFASAVAKRADAVSLCGATDLDAFFGLFRGASGCIGWCGGNTIKATYLRKPTLIAWSRYFRDPRFYRNACPPDAWGQWYEAAVVEDETPRTVAARFIDLLGRCA